MNPGSIGYIYVHSLKRLLPHFYGGVLFCRFCNSVIQTHDEGFVMFSRYLNNDLAMLRYLENNLNSM